MEQNLVGTLNPLSSLNSLARPMSRRMRSNSTQVSMYYVQANTKVHPALGVIMNEDGTMADMESLMPVRHEVKATKCAKSHFKKRKSTGIYVGLVVSIFLTVGCSVAATLLFLHVANQ